MKDHGELIALDHDELHSLIQEVGQIQSIMVWGPPGIGKTEGIETFARSMDMRFVQLLGSQMNPEDLQVPLIDPASGTTRMCPPHRILGKEYADQPLVLLIDEINAAEPDMMRAYFQVVNERRIGDLELPGGSIVIGAGNPLNTNSVARPMPAPLMDRFYHVALTLKDTTSWLAWTADKKIHEAVTSYVREQGVRTLLGEARGDNQIGTSPRAWARLGRVLGTQALGIDQALERVQGGHLSTGRFQAHVAQVARGAVWGNDAEHFARWWAMRLTTVDLRRVLSGEIPFPTDPADAMTALALIEQLRRRLAAELPRFEHDLSAATRELAARARTLIERVAQPAPELVRSVLADARIPSWYLDTLVNDQVTGTN